MLQKAGKSKGRLTPGWASLVALLVCGCAAAAWSTWNPFVLPARRLDHREPARIWWIEPGKGPAWHSVGVENADVVILGDSRVPGGLDLHWARDQGFPNLCRIWFAGGKTVDLMRPLLDWEEPRRLVICFSSLGFIGIKNKPVSATMRTPHPAMDPAMEPWRVRRWAETEGEYLLAQGFRPHIADLTLKWWIRKHGEMRTSHVSNTSFVNTQLVDNRWNSRLDNLRCSLLNPVEPSNWWGSWWGKQDPQRSDADYKLRLSQSNKELAQQNLAELIQTLSVLRSRGWSLAGVRLPIEPSLREIEANSASGGMIDELVETLEIPYLDMGVWPNSTLDGSHLHLRGAKRATRELIGWMHELWPEPTK